VYIFDIKQDQTTLQISERNVMAAKALISETGAAISGKKKQQQDGRQLRKGCQH
jgi:hypothetical protein